MLVKQGSESCLQLIFLYTNNKCKTFLLKPRFFYHVVLKFTGNGVITETNVSLTWDNLIIIS